MSIEAAYTLIAMLLTLALVGLLSQRVQTPYPIMLVIAGLVLTTIPGLEPPDLDPNLILLFFLPPLIYRESFHTSWHDFLHWLRPISTLAIGLVAATVFAVGWFTKQLFPELPWSTCFILGAVISPTDTIAVMAVIHRVRVPRRITAIIGGESLVNDATGLVALQLAIGVVLSGTFSWFSVGVNFIWTVAVGVGIGLAVGAASALVNRVVRDTTALFTFSLCTPFLAFGLATYVNASGVLAVVTTAFFVARRFHTVPADTRHQLNTVWKWCAYLIDGVSFILIGLQLHRIFNVDLSYEPMRVVTSGIYITLAVIVLRIAWVFGSAGLARWFFRREQPWNVGSLVLVSWCGVRGAISLAAALSIPMMVNGEPFAGRDIVIACTIAVILGTLVLQGLTLQPLIRLFGVRDDENMEEEERLARISMIEAALGRLDALRAEPGADPAGIDHVEQLYMERLRQLIGLRRNLVMSDGTVVPDVFTIELAALDAERRRVLALRDAEDINDSTQAHLEEGLDLSEMRLRAESRWSCRTG